MIKAKKSLGQNFLIDKNILDKIINVVPIKGKTVLEIGPGSGNLTQQILNKNPKKKSKRLDFNGSYFTDFGNIML